MRKVPIVSVLFLFILAQSAFAQWGQGSQGPRFRGDFKPVVGAWSEYQVKAPGMTPYMMKVAIVGKEGNSYWYESVTEGPGGRSVMKMLVSGDPNEQARASRA